MTIGDILLEHNQSAFQKPPSYTVAELEEISRKKVWDYCRTSFLEDELVLPLIRGNSIGLNRIIVTDDTKHSAKHKMVVKAGDLLVARCGLRVSAAVVPVEMDGKYLVSREVLLLRTKDYPVILLIAFFLSQGASFTTSLDDKIRSMGWDMKAVKLLVIPDPTGKQVSGKAASIIAQMADLLDKQEQAAHTLKKLIRACSYEIAQGKIPL